MKLSQQLIALIIIAILGLVSLGSYGLYSLRSSLVDSRKHELETVLTFAKKQVEDVINQESSGKLNREEAEKKVIDILSQFREGASYIWANDSKAISRVHVKPEKIGKFQSSYQEHIAALKDKNFIFDVGSNLKPGTNEKITKVNAVTKIPKWNWVMGLGVYMDDLSTTFWSVAIHYILIAVVIILAIGLLAIYVTKSIFKKLGGEPNYAVSITNKIAKGNLDEVIEGSFHENSLLGSIKSMQHSLREMVESIQTASSKLN